MCSVIAPGPEVGFTCPDGSIVASQADCAPVPEPEPEPEPQPPDEGGIQDGSDNNGEGSAD